VQYAINWFIDKHIIYAHPQGMLRMGDAAAISQLLYTMLDTSRAEPDSIHLIVDLQHLNHLPASVKDVYRVVTHMNHPALGWTLMLTKTQQIRFFVRALSQLTQTKVQIFDAMDDLLDFISETDPSVCDLVQMKRFTLRV